MFPGPTIELNQGDRLIVNVTNQLNTRTYVSLEMFCFAMLTLPSTGQFTGTVW